MLVLGEQIWYNREMSNPTNTSVIKRQQAMRSAVASVRAEGLEPSKAALTRMERYVDGKITAKELRSQSVAAIYAKTGQ